MAILCARYTLIKIVALCHVMHTLGVVGFRETRNWSLRPEKVDNKAKRLEIKGSVVLRSGRLEYLSSSDPVEQEHDAVAWGRYVDASKTASNFGKLRVKTSKEYDDDVQVFAAGYVEGRLTAFRIRQNYENLHSYFTKTMNASLEEPMKWIKEQDGWVRGQCGKKTGLDMPAGLPAGDVVRPTVESRLRGNGLMDIDSNHKHNDYRYWLAVCLAIRQFDGIVYGYGEAAREHGGDDVPEMAYDDLLFLESNGDLYDIIDMMDPSQRPTWGLKNGGPEQQMMKAKGSSLQEPGAREEAAERLFRSIALSGKCSALVKITPDLKEIYMGHSTWDSFTAMLRIYKHYEFELQQLQPAAQKISFSSYPGEVFSDDDFYILSSKMVLLQTTNKIFNDDLFKHLKTDSVLSWQRVRAANWLGSSGKEWVDVFKKKNSGTYNNQYMVIDLKKFRPGEDALPGLLWVAEQIPGQVQSADMTRVLMMAAYWPSMNIPHFPKVYEASGYPDFINQVSKQGKEFTKTTHWLSYEISPRSKIFRRDQASVDSLEKMKAIMRSNNWRNDPFSEYEPISAICGRGDLSPTFLELRGCYDTKVTSYTMALHMRSEAVNGPTRGNDDTLPPFDWNAITSPPEHVGQPETFDYSFETMDPEHL